MTKKKTKLFIQRKYGAVIMLAEAFFVLLFIALLGICLYVGEITITKSNFWQYIFVLGLFILCIWGALYNCQTMELSEDGIVIKSPLVKYCRLKWADIEKVSLKLLPTLLWRYNCITISNGNDIPEKKQYALQNRKNKSPFVLLYKPKHLPIIAEYFAKYRPDINLTEILTPPTRKPKARWGNIFLFASVFCIVMGLITGSIQLPYGVYRRKVMAISYIVQGAIYLIICTVLFVKQNRLKNRTTENTGGYQK